MAYTLTEQDREIARQMARQQFDTEQRQLRTQKPKGNFFTSLMPTAGGTGGALGGAALGASIGSIVPGIGTAIGGLAGAILGGAGGSAAGKFGQNVVEGEQDLGKGVLGEALLGGITSTPLTAGFKLAKAGVQGARGLGGAAKQTLKEAGQISIPKSAKDLQERAAADILSSAPTGVAPQGVVSRIGQRFTESGSGLKAEPTAGGIGRLQEQSQFMARYTGSPRQQRIAMEKDMGNLSNQVDSILAKNPTPISGKDVKLQIQSAIEDPLKYADIDLGLPGVQRTLQSHLNKFGGTSTAKEMNDYIKQLNPIAKRAQDKIVRGVNVTDKEAAALAAKRAGDEVLTAIPEIKPLKRDMAQIFEVTPQVAKAAEKSIGLPFMAGVSFKAPVQAAKGAQSVLGGMMQGGRSAGAAAAGANGAGILGTAARQSLLGGRPGMGVQPEAAPQIDPTTGLPIEGQALPGMGGDMTSLAGAGDASSILGGGASATPGSIYSREAAAQDIQNDLQRTGGQNMDKYLKLYEFLNPEPDASANKPLSAEASKVLANANSGLKSLSQLGGMIQQGGVPMGTLLPGREMLGGLGSRIAGTSSFDTAAKNVTDVITRLRTGAALTESEEKFYKSQLPQAFDPPEVQAQKLQMFQDLFSSIANRTGSAGTDAQSALMSGGF